MLILFIVLFSLHFIMLQSLYISFFLLMWCLACSSLSSSLRYTIFWRGTGLMVCPERGIWIRGQALAWARLKVFLSIVRMRTPKNLSSFLSPCLLSSQVGGEGAPEQGIAARFLLWFPELWAGSEWDTWVLPPAQGSFSLPVSTRVYRMTDSETVPVITSFSSTTTGLWISASTNLLRKVSGVSCR